jgi:hypothetical protein
VVMLTTRDLFCLMNSRKPTKQFLLTRLMDSKSVLNGPTHGRTSVYRGKCVGCVKVGFNIQFNYQRVLWLERTSVFTILSTDSEKDSIRLRLVKTRYT